MAKSVTIYGIKNCDTMKKARTFLDKKGVAYDFHDYKVSGIDRAKLEGCRARSAGKRCSIAPARRSASCPITRRIASPKKRR